MDLCFYCWAMWSLGLRCRCDSDQLLKLDACGAHNLRAVVEVVPVVAGAHPVVVGGGVVGLVVGVGRRVVELAGLGVLAGGLGVEGGGGLTVEGGEHLHTERGYRLAHLPSTHGSTPGQSERTGTPVPTLLRPPEPQHQASRGKSVA